MKNCYFKLSKKPKIFALFLMFFLFTFFVIWSNINIGNNFLYNLCIFAYEQDTRTYAKANNNCALYSSTNFNSSTLLFYVPESYFVSLISATDDNKYFVSYNNFSGYVDAENISLVSFVPNTPTLENITFDISTMAGTQIWDSPNTNGKIFATIPAGTKNIKYIAATLGEIPIGGKTNLWYYAEYTPVSNATKVYQGYVYSESTINISHIALNPESEPQNLTFTKPNQGSISLGSAINTTMIVLICLPFAILFIYAIIKMILELVKNRKTKIKNQKLEEHQSSSRPVRALAHKSFTRKKDNLGNAVEVVFPEYNYIDDDDLL